MRWPAADSKIGAAATQTSSPTAVPMAPATPTWSGIRAQVTTKSVVGHVLTDEMAEPECVDDRALPVGYPEPVAVFELHFGTAEVEGRRPEDLASGRPVVDHRPVRAFRNREMDLGRDLVARVPVGQSRVHTEHPVWSQLGRPR
jgi:hypothetical protein